MKAGWIAVMVSGSAFCVYLSKAQMVNKPGSFHLHTNLPALALNQPTNILNLNSNRSWDALPSPRDEPYRPGIYETRPYEMMIMVPGSGAMADRMETRPLQAPNMPVIKPKLQTTPQHSNTNSP